MDKTWIYLARFNADLCRSSALRSSSLVLHLDTRVSLSIAISSKMSARIWWKVFSQLKQ